MNNIQLETSLKSHPITRHFFRGVYAYDLIPKTPSIGYYIFNLDPSHLPGSHWIAINIREKDEKNFFFDSYGYAPKRYKFKKFLGNNYHFNRQSLQYPLSTVCGQWCMFFIYFSCKNYNPREIFYPFSLSNDALKNDHVMNTVVEKIFNIKAKIIDVPFLRSQIAKEMKRNLKCCKYYCTLTNPRCLKKRDNCSRTNSQCLKKKRKKTLRN